MTRCSRLLPLLLAGLAVPAHAQTSNVQTQAESRIVDQFSLTGGNNLAFGAVLPPTAGSNTVTIDASSGGRALAGGGNARLIGGGANRATYTVEGDGGQTFDIDVDPTVTLTRANGSETIEVTLTPSVPGDTLSGTAGTPGSANFGVGGSFQVTASTVPGSYSGTFTVTVDNN
ncbi:MAG TPA: DUF4402 domain-containing protein [Allosphingosinicella sp.]|uniref:DUF4402 domain-containing protein n=1 Tax=Allosphingosinicella sp. TaxID=2823234 RepID=UPI002EDB038D